jgi:hypothetical protein
VPDFSTGIGWWCWCRPRGCRAAARRRARRVLDSSSRGRPEVHTMRPCAGDPEISTPAGFPASARRRFPMATMNDLFVALDAEGQMTRVELRPDDSVATLQEHFRDEECSRACHAKVSAVAVAVGPSASSAFGRRRTIGLVLDPTELVLTFLHEGPASPEIEVGLKSCEQGHECGQDEGDRHGRCELSESEDDRRCSRHRQRGKLDDGWPAAEDSSTMPCVRDCFVSLRHEMSRCRIVLLSHGAILPCNRRPGSSGLPGTWEFP